MKFGFNWYWAAVVSVMTVSILAAPRLYAAPDGPTDDEIAFTLTAFVYELLRDSTIFVGDRYWWIDCPDVATFMEMDEENLSEETKAATRECMESEEQQEFWEANQSAIKLGGYHRESLFFEELSERVAQASNLGSLREALAPQGWHCSEIVSGTKYQFLSFGLPGPPLVPEGEEIWSSVCYLDFQHRVPFFFFRWYGHDPTTYDRTSTLSGEWKLIIAARSLSSPPVLADSMTEQGFEVP